MGLKELIGSFCSFQQDNIAKIQYLNTRSLETQAKLRKLKLEQLKMMQIMSHCQATTLKTATSIFRLRKRSIWTRVSWLTFDEYH